jgi:molecular chaperone DnaK (HSP70)
MTIDSSDGRMYIGSRTCSCKPEEDFKYLGSFKDATFKPTQKKILKVFDTREKAFKHECYLHFVLDVSLNPKFANRARVTTTGFTWLGQKHTPETIEKIRIASKNMPKETRERIRQAHKNKKLTKEHVEKLRKSNLGKKRSIETRQKISDKAKGRKLKESTKKKISLHNKGKWINRKDQSKSIYLKNIETGVVEFFVSQKEAVRVLGVHQASLNRVATKKQYSCKGWILHEV